MVQGVAQVVLVVLSDLPLINLSSNQVQCTAKNHFICKIKCVELRSFNIVTGLLLPWTLFVGFPALNLLDNRSGLPDFLVQRDEFIVIPLR